MTLRQDFDVKCSDTDTSGSPYIDFAGSDSLLKDSEYEAYPDLQMLPMVRSCIVALEPRDEALDRTMQCCKTSLRQA